MGRNPLTNRVSDTMHWDGECPVPMKRPLLALLMDNGFRDDILNGLKTITIREGWRDYKVGEKCVLCCTNSDAGWTTMGKLTAVTHCQLKDVPQADLEADGMPTLEDAISSLSAFYENIGEDSLVTVLRWQLV